MPVGRVELAVLFAMERIETNCSVVAAVGDERSRAEPPIGALTQPVFMPSTQVRFRSRDGTSVAPVAPSRSGRTCQTCRASRANGSRRSRVRH